MPLFSDAEFLHNVLVKLSAGKGGFSPAFALISYLCREITKGL
jgi:hypothetical protein